MNPCNRRTFLPGPTREGITRREKCPDALAECHFQPRLSVYVSRAAPCPYSSILPRFAVCYSFAGFFPCYKSSMLTIEHWPIERFRPYERNPRKNDKAVDQMRASLREFGFAVPVLARSTGDVCDGHLRLKAAAVEKQWPSGDVAAIPVVLCDGWTEAQMKAFRLMANRSVTWADWDMEALAMEFGELKAMDFDLSLTGFDTREIDQFTLAVNPAEDDVPPVPEVPVTRTGDLWLLGDHRLLCGDSTKAEDVGLLMDGKRSGLMNTDPPYGVGYANDERPNPGVAKPRVAKDELHNAALQEFLESAFRLAVNGALLPHAAWYLWHAHLTQGFFAAAAAAAAAHVILHRQIIWVKPVLLLGRGQYHWKHEPCFMGWVEGNMPVDYAERTETTVWEVGSVSQAERKEFNHSTPKPVELFRRPIMKHLAPGEIAYDPFAGTGPQFIAAELTGRRCFGLEIEPAYCDCIVTRWQNLTGKQATLEGSGATFEHVKAGRRQEAEDAIMEECHEALG